MSTILNLFLLCVIVCFIVDCSGFIDDGLKPLVSRIINKKSKIKVKPENITIGKPISCSMCMCFWTGIIYLLCVSEFTIPNLTIVALLALLSSNISGLLLTMKDILATLECWIQKTMR